jgi:8-oxo-dGTP pyrophosphatase MutT (NUDIX family)
MDRKFGIATKAIIKNDEEKYLVLYKSETEEISPNEIDIPGGRIEFGEGVEEMGINIEIEKPSRVWGFIKDDLHLVGITFLAKYIDGEIKLSGEHTKYEWVNKDKILMGDYPEWIKEEFKIV